MQPLQLIDVEHATMPLEGLGYVRRHLFQRLEAEIAFHGAEGLRHRGLELCEPFENSGAPASIDQLRGQPGVFEFFDQRQGEAA